MGRKKGLITGFLSTDASGKTENTEREISEYSENQPVGQLTEGAEKYEQEKKEKSEKSDIQRGRTSDRLVKRRKWAFKGFYISPENNLRLKELELAFLKMGEKKDISDIINQAIEELHRKICS